VVFGEGGGGGFVGGGVLLGVFGGGWVVVFWGNGGFVGASVGGGVRVGVYSGLFPPPLPKAIVLGPRGNPPAAAGIAIFRKLPDLCLQDGTQKLFSENALQHRETGAGC